MDVKLEFYGTRSTWRDVADAARTTINRAAGAGEPSSAWKKRMLLAEHSPIRQLVFRWKWVGLKSWVSVHLVRHKFGIDHFVSTQRSDRTGVDRDASRQDTPVTHECIANAQAILSISRKRLCRQASPETRAAWGQVVEALRANASSCALRTAPSVTATNHIQRIPSAKTPPASTSVHRSHVGSWTSKSRKANSNNAK